MKNLYRNAIVLALAGCFLALNLIGETANAQQTKNSKKATPAPAKKTSTKDSKTTAKTTPKPTSKTTTAAPKSNAKTVAKPTKAPVKSNQNVSAKKEKSNLTQKTSSNQKSSTTNTATKKKEVSTTAKKETRPISKSSSKPKLTTKPIIKTSDAEQVIVVATDSRIRQQPRANATQLSQVKIGKLLPVLERNGAWHRVQYEADKSGWIAKNLTRDYANDDRDEIYEDIANKYAGSKSLDFTAAVEVSDFLRTAQALARKDTVKADLAFKRLLVLAVAVNKIPSGKGDGFPYKSFLQAHEKEVVYSEPSGMWLVRSDIFWELHGKFTQYPIAEDIAWAAAKNDIPGECEGYINCQLYVLRAMEGEYLNFYPNGKYSRQALEIVTVSLGVMVNDINNKATFTPLADISDRAEFNRFLTELRTIISKVSDADKAKSLQYINQLGEGYK